jgi:hypothetical protein
MNFFSENHSGHVNIDSGTGYFYSPFSPGIDIHIESESVFTSPRNFYSHAPESTISLRNLLIRGIPRCVGERIYARMIEAGPALDFDD